MLKKIKKLEEELKKLSRLGGRFLSNQAKDEVQKELQRLKNARKHT